MTQALNLSCLVSRGAWHPVTLEQLIACWVTHDFAHVNQISRVLVRHFGQEIGPWTAYFRLLR